MTKTTNATNLPISIRDGRHAWLYNASLSLSRDPSAITDSPFLDTLANALNERPPQYTTSLNGHAYFDLQKFCDTNNCINSRQEPLLGYNFKSIQDANWRELYSPTTVWFSGAKLDMIDMDSSYYVVGANYVNAHLNYFRAERSVMPGSDFGRTGTQLSRDTDLDLTYVQMQGGSFHGRHLGSYTNLFNLNVDRENPNVRGMDLQGFNVDISFADDGDDAKPNLMGFTAPDSNVAGMSIQNTELSYAEFSGTHGNNVRLGSNDMEFVDISGANLFNALIAYCNARGIKARDANLQHLTVHDTDMSVGDFSGVDLTRLDSRENKWIGVTFEETLIGNGRINGDTFDKAIFNNANLTGTTISGSTFFKTRCNGHRASHDVKKCLESSGAELDGTNQFNPQNASSSSPSSLGAGAIIGIAFAGVAAAIILFCFLYILIANKLEKQKGQKEARTRSLYNFSKQIISTFLEKINAIGGCELTLAEYEQHVQQLITKLATHTNISERDVFVKDHQDRWQCTLGTASRQAQLQDILNMIKTVILDTKYAANKKIKIQEALHAPQGQAVAARSTDDPEPFTQDNLLEQSIATIGLQSKYFHNDSARGLSQKIKFSIATNSTAQRNLRAGVATFTTVPVRGGSRETVFAPQSISLSRAFIITAVAEQINNERQEVHIDVSPKSPLLSSSSDVNYGSASIN